MGENNVEDEDYTTSDEDDELDNYVPQNSAEAANKFEETRTELGTGYDAMARHEDSLLGPQCIVIFKLPDGSLKRHEEFRMGHTVEWLKQAVEDTYELQYHSQKLYFNDKMMIDPLSLSDINGLAPDQENYVEVRV
jgi:hypothetical protein|mmetsp:Transcript_11196/g.20676  ORF Transcript_11196/g.20676 Transcript_11196/m.20676 type:complete len:136 (+) Transcript_11196:84-491(+)|eukprot:CAMPEP_0174284796 /NCGR_PEP_ID=MMETSP0809-20121228/6824_1 /TAXON_ID=73025 ORGANISM="Eutreptiella gymnastica-like, Strain CCMP1594" /NCGR_SAMPLE_ID=MMETSP0809 /ASSEMBLY_ACC=CAM_ASM_000658 /LENGTH=135 /DNA_ID=CAMNT_0015380433 /DNA_START=66 /DNA_END=473 /DNA_ORIENTATION=-